MFWKFRKWGIEQISQPMQSHTTGHWMNFSIEHSATTTYMHC